MKSTSLITLVLTILCCCAHGANAAVNDDGDWQFWEHYTFTHKLRDGVTGSFDVMLRSGDDASEVWYRHFDLGLIFRITPRLAIKPSYRNKSILRGSDRQWIRIHNPGLNGILSFSVRSWEFKNVCRFSYWDFEAAFNRTDRWFYRNILTALPPMSMTDHKIRPFLKEDFFFDLHEGRITRNRLSTGIVSGRSKTCRPALYLMWEAVGESWGPWEGWNDNYILGLDILCKF